MGEQRLVAGIDVGAGSTKVALVNEAGELLGKAKMKTTPPFEGTASAALKEACDQVNITTDDIDYIATTGLGRYSIPFRKINITDITCTARGAYRCFPKNRFILDIGAQSTRAIHINEGGKVHRFQCNEKCAAGCGTFLDRVSRYLEVPVEELGDVALRAKRAHPISSVCAVLAESEIINHVSEGRSVEEIIFGVHVSLAQRALSQLRRIGLDGPITFTGGVALQAGMLRACQEKFEVDVDVPDDPQIVAAHGAAILGWQRFQKHA